MVDLISVLAEGKMTKKSETKVLLYNCISSTNYDDSSIL